MNRVQVGARDGLRNAADTSKAVQSKALKGSWRAHLEVNDTGVKTREKFLETLQNALSEGGFFGFVSGVA